MMDVFWLAFFLTRKKLNTADSNWQSKATDILKFNDITHKQIQVKTCQL